MSNLTKATFLRTCPYVRNLEYLKQGKSGTRLHHFDLSEFKLNAISHEVVKFITELENGKQFYRSIRT